MNSKIIITVNPNASKYNPEKLRESMKKKPKEGVVVNRSTDAICFSTENYGGRY